MDPWIPEDYYIDEERIGKAVKGLYLRIYRQKRRRNSVRQVTRISFFILIALLLIPFFRDSVTEKEISQSNAVVSSERTLMSDNSISTEMSTDSSKEKGSQSRGATGIDADRALTVSLEKVGQGIALQWLGEDEREYVIYKCTTPRFDTCTVVTEVQGPGWVDREAEIGGVIYYKVELKS